MFAAKDKLSATYDKHINFEMLKLNTKYNVIKDADSFVNKVIKSLQRQKK